MLHLRHEQSNTYNAHDDLYAGRMYHHEPGTDVPREIDDKVYEFYESIDRGEHGGGPRDFITARMAFEGSELSKEIDASALYLMPSEDPDFDYEAWYADPAQHLSDLHHRVVDAEGLIRRLDEQIYELRRERGDFA